MHQKQGQKPHRIALRRVGGAACSFSAFSSLPSRLRDRRHVAPIPQIQTNSSGSYRRSNKCRTFTFSSEGSATMSPPPPSPTTRSCPHRNPRAFQRCLFSSSSPVLISFLARVPARGSCPVTRAHVYATLLCTMVPPHSPQLALHRASWHLQIFRF